MRKFIFSTMVSLNGFCEDRSGGMVCPILLGNGNSLFGVLTRNFPLQLSQSKARRPGIVELVYELARNQP